MAKPGREAVAKHIKSIKAFYQPDITIANAENAAHGSGLTLSIAKEILGLGVDVLTGGNHTFSKKEVIQVFNQHKQVIRPLNFSTRAPGAGIFLFTTPKGKKILVVNLIGRLYMEPFISCPFAAMESVLKTYQLGKNVDAIFVDIHAEATSEKLALARCFQGRITAVIGTHTHVPTADHHILANGTAYQSDAGMCGDYNSVLGVTDQTAFDNFHKTLPRPPKQLAEAEGTLCGCVVRVTPEGLASAIVPVRQGPWVGMEKLQALP